MTFSVTVLPTAENQMLAMAIWWADQRSSEQAAAWLSGLEQAITQLQSDPESWPVATESDRFDFALREMPYGLNNKKTHRVLFEVSDDRVFVH